MTNFVELRYLDGVGYSSQNNGKFIYNIDNDSIGRDYESQFSSREYFLSKKINGNLLYITTGNKQIAVPLLKYKLEKNNIKAKVKIDRVDNKMGDIIVSFPSKAELSLFLFRSVDIIGN
jgi:hypothetical protein